MTSSNANRLKDALTEAGWSFARATGKHEVWRCPPECGRHMASVPRAGGADLDKHGPIVRRIAECRKHLEAKAALRELQIEEVPPQVTLVDRTVQAEPTVIPQTRLQSELTPSLASKAAVVREVRRIAGLEVVTVEPAIIPHQLNPEITYAARGAFKALLVDGSEVYGCDDCDFTSPNGKSVESHRNGTHDRVAPKVPHTPPEIIRAVLRAAAAARLEGARNYFEAAAATLNAAGLHTSRGAEWAPGAVKHIVQKYGDNPAYRIRVTQAARARVVKTAPAVPVPVRADDITTIEPALALALLADAVAGLADDLRALAKRLDNQPAADPEVVEKARRYDQLKDILA